MNGDYIHQLETTHKLLTNDNAKLREANEALKKRILMYENHTTGIAVFQAEAWSVPRGNGVLRKGVKEHVEIRGP